jgi:hypothetical protein
MNLENIRIIGLSVTFFAHKEGEIKPSGRLAGATSPDFGINWTLRFSRYLRLFFLLLFFFSYSFLFSIGAGIKIY